MLRIFSEAQEKVSYLSQPYAVQIEDQSVHTLRILQLICLSTIHKTTTQRHGISLYIVHVVSFPNIIKHYTPAQRLLICRSLVLVQVDCIWMGIICMLLPEIFIIREDFFIKLVSSNLRILR